MFPGGTPLLLQSLHPLAMAGVAGHSGYKGDPWGRLQRTSHYLAITTYGTIEHAHDVIGHVRASTSGCAGATSGSDRTPRATPPAALGARGRDRQLPAGPPDVRRRAAEPSRHRLSSRPACPGLCSGCLTPPRSVAELRQALADYRPELEASRAAKEAARFLLLNPPLPLFVRPGYGTLASGALSLLPAWPWRCSTSQAAEPGRALSRAAARPRRHPRRALGNVGPGLLTRAITSHVA